MRSIVLLGLAVLAACGSITRKEDATSDSSNAAGPVAELSIESSANAAGKAREVGEISMPIFAPQYPGSLIKSAVNSSTGGVKTHEVRLATKDDAAKIFEFYRGRFAATGLQKSADFQSGGTGMLAAAGGSRKASIAMTKEQDHNIVIVTFSGE